MSEGILIVRSRPDSSAALDDFNRWYDDVHIREVLALDGFRSARRFSELDGDSFVVVYDVDDVDVARMSLAEARTSGRLTRPTSVELNPPPTSQWFCDAQGD